MTLFRNTQDNRLYRMYRVSPRFYTGAWMEVEDFITGMTTRLTESRKKFFVAVAHA